MRVLMAPSMEEAPTLQATPTPVPEMTVVPKKQRLVASKGCTRPSVGSEVFSMASDSPVSWDSPTKRSRVAMRRMSAGMMSPAARWMMSPRTTSDKGIS